MDASPLHVPNYLYLRVLIVGQVIVLEEYAFFNLTSQVDPYRFIYQLLVPESLDRFQVGSPQSRVPTEEDANCK